MLVLLLVQGSYMVPPGTTRGGHHHHTQSVESLLDWNLTTGTLLIGPSDPAAGPTGTRGSSGGGSCHGEDDGSAAASPDGGIDLGRGIKSQAPATPTARQGVTEGATGPGCGRQHSGLGPFSQGRPTADHDDDGSHRPAGASIGPAVAASRQGVCGRCAEEGTLLGAVQAWHGRLGRQYPEGER